MVEWELILSITHQTHKDTHMQKATATDLLFWSAHLFPVGYGFLCFRSNKWAENGKTLVYIEKQLSKWSKWEKEEKEVGYMIFLDCNSPAILYLLTTSLHAHWFMQQKSKDDKIFQIDDAYCIKTNSDRSVLRKVENNNFNVFNLCVCTYKMYLSHV